MTNETDPIGLYDPLLSAVSPKGDHPHFRGGYKVWPSGAGVSAADVRLMCIGNSTSLWPGADWSLRVAKAMTSDTRSVAVFNGAGKGNTSSQEVLRILRDAPAIKPDVIVSLSGICDIGYLLNAKNYPFRHKYTRRAMDFLRENDVVEDVVFGVPDEASPAQIWCRNQRLGRVMAEDMGIRMVTCLQPILGFGDYSPSPEEAHVFSKKAPVILKSANKTYHECVVEFYTEVLKIMAEDPRRYDHVVDLTNAFSDTSNSYRDHRHQTDIGVECLANKIRPHIEHVLTAREKETL